MPVSQPAQPAATQCEFCSDAPIPKEQFYETKLFRVLVARSSVTPGHMILMPKSHNPHFYGLSLDELEEFGYLLKKVSFWAMRQTHAPGFSLVMNDGTPEAAKDNHLMIHIIPRQFSDQAFTYLSQAVLQVMKPLDDASLEKTVSDMKNLMQLPQS